MYVIEDFTMPSGMRCATLHQLTAKELARVMLDKAVDISQGRRAFDIVSAAYAHKWVLRGGHHTTPLYVADNGRIRRARDTSPPWVKNLMRRNSMGLN